MSIPEYPPDILFARSVDRLVLSRRAGLSQAMAVMEGARHHGLPPGLCLVVDEQRRLEGVITDGDVRDALLRGRTMRSPVTTVMTRRPVAIPASLPPSGALAEIQRQIRASGRQRTIRHAVLVDGRRRVLALLDVDRLILTHSSYWEKIGVIGLGHVGLCVAVALAESGLNVVGWERDPGVRRSLALGRPHFHEQGVAALLRAQLGRKTFRIARSAGELASCRIFLVCVNTPARKGRADLSHLRSALASTANLLKTGDLLIVRSTVPVGTCRTLVKKEVERATGLRVGKDIGVAHAPERVMMGRVLEELHTLPQVIGGINDWSVETASRVFSKLSPNIVRMNSLEEAEFVKLINNTFRDLSFAFANEVSALCETHNLNAARIIRAANIGYPRNPIPLPSPGVGGTCLTKDPYLLANGARRNGLASLPRLGRKINEGTPVLAARRLLKALRECGKNPSTCKVFVLGFAFKGEPETTDMRGSPTLDFIRALRPRVRAVYGYDALIPKEVVESTGARYRRIPAGFSASDAVVFMNNHRSFSTIDIYGLARSMRRPAVIFDGWSFFDPEEVERIPGVRYMGLGYITPWSRRAGARPG
ncbi:MAG: nucleotide sugar dehydrogenase [Nitrospirae bacterium]|nr:nucleotide sugar dehydrogenase [Nitrospirota bacterium]